MPYKSREDKNAAQRRYRERHPEVVERERVQHSANRWYYKAEPTYYCSDCGDPLGKKHKSGMCKSCELKTKKISIACQKCGDVFIGDKRSKYCETCKKNTLPSLLDAIRCFNQRVRAKAKGLSVDFRPRDWRSVLRDFGNCCAYCGGVKELQQDHFVPLAKGGGSTRNNIVPACERCNSKKSDSDPREWLPREKYERIANYLQSRM